jgi:hypothetical protein
VQRQDKIVHRPSFAVTRSFVDQLVRAGDLEGKLLDQVNKFIDRAERLTDAGNTSDAKDQLHALAQQLKHEAGFESLVEALEAQANA